MRTKKNTYEQVTDRIIELLEAGVCPWRQPWSKLNITPQNFTNGRPYSGINLLLLNSIGFQVPVYMTFKQVKEKGGQIIKGSRGFPVIYWNMLEVEEKQHNSEKTPKAKIPYLKHYTVFNASQIEGIEFPKFESTNTAQSNPIEKAEIILANWQDCPQLDEHRGRACYSVYEDIIQMPSRDSFFKNTEFYSTLFHEAGHATGHKSRLDRNLQGRFGSKSYAKEELIAEMTSAFLCAECGIDNDVIENQSAYIQSWLNALKNDSKLLITAASAAQKAANYILGKPISQHSTAA